MQKAMLRFPPHLSNELVWRQKYTIWLMLWPSDESGLPSHVTRNTQHICPMGPCLVLAQLSHVAIPFSHKDSLIPTEFQADEWGHQKCCLFFFFLATPDWLASLERQVTGAHLEIKERQKSRGAGTGCGDLGREEREAQPGTVSTFHQRTLKRQGELLASPTLPVVLPSQILYWPLQVPLHPGPSTHLGGLPKLLTSVHKVGQG